VRSVILFLLAAACTAQQRTLTLAEAEAMAVRNHPRLKAAQLEASAGAEQTNQVRAAMLPSVVWNSVGSLSEHNTRWGASGNINPSSLFSRTASGININQTLFDFGRTSTGVRAARLRAAALDETAVAAHAQIVLAVRQAYFRALLAAAAHRVADQTLGSRRLVLKQVNALAQSNLRSTLDVGFAELAVSESELTLLEAENLQRSAMIDLAAALGTEDDASFQLQDEPLPSAMAPEVNSLVKEAMEQRPDLLAARRRLEAARASAELEGRQRLPSVSAVAVGGVFGPRDERLHPHYGAAGVNLQIPVFNGGLFASRRREADLRAQSVASLVRDLEIGIAREVKNAWLSAGNAASRLDQTGRLQEQASRTLRLATSRYELGLSSIVELNQAQLSVAAAETAAASARFEYQIRRATLDFQIGRLR
jgi:outer membrane protein